MDKGMIEFFNSEGKKIGEVKRANHQRSSSQAASDQKKMDAWKASHDDTYWAEVPIWGRFIFNVRGQSFRQAN